MSKSSKRFADFPPTIAASTAHPARSFRQADGYFAVHGLHDAETPLVHLEKEGISIFAESSATRNAAVARAIPVYQTQAGGSLFVPTGLVFVRLTAGTELVSLSDAFLAAGYEIVQQLDYAKNSGWLKSRSGDLAEALAHIDRLAILPGVEGVEPQMLTQSSHK